MRWDKLFDDLEAQADDLELQERDALVTDLRDEDWAGTSWRELLGGHVSLDVLGGGRLDGVVTLVNEQLVQMRGEGVDHVVAAAAVIEVIASQRRAGSTTTVEARLGWGRVFRVLRDSGEGIRLRLVDGTARDGVVHVVGRDFVRLRAESGRDHVVAWQAVAVVSGRS